MDTNGKLRTFLSRFFDGKSLEDDDNLFESGAVNSLFAMQLVVFVEREFSIVIQNDELDMKNFQSINAISDLVSAKTN